MGTIAYDVNIRDSRNTIIAALLDNSIVEYKVGLSDVRVLQSAFIGLATLLEEHASYTGILVIDDARISKTRLFEEWKSWSKLFQPSILSRIRMVVFLHGSIIQKNGRFSNDETEALYTIQNQLWKKSKNNKRKRSDSLIEIFRVLLVHWFRGSGPLQITKISQQTGFSFPTVAGALEKLESHLKRNSDRSVELITFPRNYWFKLTAAMDNVRVPQGYWARNPRSINDLIDRINENADRDIAFGGIIGASNYFPGIDLVGIHRIDLCVHNWSLSKIDKFTRKLDPGLKKVESGELPQVVLHNLSRPESFFTKSNDIPTADEVECLLDLYEARMESQADELLEHFIGRIGK